jgi:hypothetical protein
VAHLLEASVPEIERKRTDLLAGYELLRPLHALNQQQDADTVGTLTGQISVGTEILLLEQNLLLCALVHLQKSTGILSSGSEISTSLSM